MLAAGQLFTRPEERTVQSRTVTLALKPDGSRHPGRGPRPRNALALALRGVNDHDLVSRPAAKPAIDPEARETAEARGGEAVQARRGTAAIEGALLAKKPAEPPRRQPTQSTPRIATIYRGIHNAQRIRTDQTATAELEPAEPAAIPRRHGQPGRQDGCERGQGGRRR